MVIPDEKTVHHVMSGTALDGFPFGGVEKDKMMVIVQRYSRLYFTEVMRLCIMDNHLVARVYPE